MRSNPHPRIVFAKGTTRVVAKDVARADDAGLATSKGRLATMIYAPRAERAAWIEAELAREDVLIQTGRGVTEVIAALLDDPPPRPQVLVIDFDALGPGEILELHTVRDQGWCGTIFAIGKVPVGIRRSLRIEQVLSQRDNALREAVSEVGFDAQTRRMPVFSAT